VVLGRIIRGYLMKNHLSLAIARPLLTPFAAKYMGPSTRSSPYTLQLHLLLHPGLL